MVGSNGKERHVMGDTYSAICAQDVFEGFEFAGFLHVGGDDGFVPLLRCARAVRELVFVVEELTLPRPCRNFVGALILELRKLFSLQRCLSIMYRVVDVGCWDGTAEIEVIFWDRGTDKTSTLLYRETGSQQIVCSEAFVVGYTAAAGELNDPQCCTKVRHNPPGAWNPRVFSDIDFKPR